MYSRVKFLGMTMSSQKVRLFVFVAAVLLINYLLYSIYHHYYATDALRTPKEVFRHNGITYYVPAECLNPKSAYYGMIYKDIYGLPLNEVDGLKIRQSKEDWKLFFPELISGIENYILKNRNRKFDLFTRTASVFAKQTEYALGEDFVATLQSLDSWGRKKRFGGDYYRVRLVVDSSSSPDGIPCHVLDNGDGTYTLRAPLVSEGQFTVDVKLVLSVEGIHEVIEKTTERGCWGYTYLAQFESGDIMQCNVNLTTDEKMKGYTQCNYSNPRNGAEWYCLKPPSSSCSRIVNVAYRGPGRGTKLEFEEICKKYGCHLSIKTDVKIIVKKSKGYKTRKLPFCHECFARNDRPFRASGYFQKSRWNSLQCSNTIQHFREVNRCMKNKAIYFFGDSTIRQFFEWATLKLWLTTDGPDSSVFWQQPKIATDGITTDSNITLYYRAHGPPLQNPGPPSSRPYISDSIDGIPIGGKGVYIIFNIGAHLLNYEPSAYIQRLRGIRDAIQRHLEKFPDTRVIVRGQNVVEYPFEWSIYRFEIILKKMFGNINNVLFLDLWDFTTVWPLNDYHPIDQKLDQQAMLLFSFVCA